MCMFRYMWISIFNYEIPQFYSYGQPKKNFQNNVKPSSNLRGVKKIESLKTFLHHLIFWAKHIFLHYFSRLMAVVFICLLIIKTLIRLSETKLALIKGIFMFYKNSAYILKILFVSSFCVFFSCSVPLLKHSNALFSHSMIHKQLRFSTNFLSSVHMS